MGAQWLGISNESRAPGCAQATADSVVMTDVQRGTWNIEITRADEVVAGGRAPGKEIDLLVQSAIDRGLIFFGVDLNSWVA